MRDLKIRSIYVVNDIITSPHKATAKLREGKQFGRQQVSGIASFRVTPFKIDQNKNQNRSIDKV